LKPRSGRLGAGDYRIDRWAHPAHAGVDSGLRDMVAMVERLIQ
jgi:hypothetical protein